MSKIVNRLYYTAFILLMLIVCGYSTVLFNTISKRELSIGDNIDFIVSILAPSKTKIIPPETDAGFGNFIVKEWDNFRVEKKSCDSIVFKYTITSYTVERCSIPALPFIVLNDKKNDTLYSDTIPMKVISVIAQSAKQGDTVRLKDIKPQQKAGTPSLLWLWILIAAGVVAALLFYSRSYWMNRKKSAPPPPPKPPYEEAIEALAQLEAKEYLIKGMFREYVFELSEILKRYMGRRFSINAADWTTEEVLEWISTAPFEAEHCRSMEWFFTTTHLVKFAKVIPDTATVRQLMDETKLFIQKTRPAADHNKEQQNLNQNKEKA